MQRREKYHTKMRLHDGAKWHWSHYAAEHDGSSFVEGVAKEVLKDSAHDVNYESDGMGDEECDPRSRQPYTRGSSRMA